MIPRPVAYRIWSACLTGQARHLNDLASRSAADKAHRRGGLEARQSAESAAAGRRQAAAIRERWAQEIRSWIGSEAGPRGGDLPDDLVGLVAAALYSHGESVARVRELAGPLAPPASEPVRLIRHLLSREPRP